MADEKKFLKPVSIQECCDELGFEYIEVENDESQAIKRKITRLINVADKYLKGAIGDNYPVNDERAKEMALLIISDLYDQRETDSKKISGPVQKILHDLEWQLKLELGVKNV